MRNLLVVLLVTFISPFLWAGLHIKIENIDNEQVRFLDDSFLSLKDLKGHRYTIRCENHFISGEHVQMYLIKHRLHANFQDCQGFLDELRVHLESGKSLQSIDVQLAQKKGTGRMEASVQFNSDVLQPRIEGMDLIN